MAKKRFLCRYLSNGKDYAVHIAANNANDAARIMRRIDWAPGCGPVGEPERVWPLRQQINSWICAFSPIDARNNLWQNSALRPLLSAVWPFPLSDTGKSPSARW